MQPIFKNQKTMTKMELRSKISNLNAEKIFARDMAEDSTIKEDIEIWEAIELAYTDLIYKLENIFKSKS